MKLKFYRILQALGVTKQRKQKHWRKASFTIIQQIITLHGWLLDHVRA